MEGQQAREKKECKVICLRDTERKGWMHKTFRQVREGDRKQEMKARSTRES